MTNENPRRGGNTAGAAEGNLAHQESTSPPPIFQSRSPASTATSSGGDRAPRPSTLLDWALAYASRGFRVLPLHNMREGRCTCGQDCGKNAAKHPRVKGGYKAATTDPEQIKAWWVKWSTANIGIATGRDSRLVVLDVDGSQGLMMLRALIAQHEPFPRTATVKTARGWHIWFRYPESLSAIPCSAGAGLDVRGDGGYCIAPPSVHATDHVYDWCEPDDVG